MLQRYGTIVVTMNGGKHAINVVKKQEDDQ